LDGCHAGFDGSNFSCVGGFNCKTIIDNLMYLESKTTQLAQGWHGVGYGINAHPDLLPFLRENLL